MTSYPKKLKTIFAKIQIPDCFVEDYQAAEVQAVAEVKAVSQAAVLKNRPLQNQQARNHPEAV